MLSKTSQYGLQAIHVLLERPDEWLDVESIARECQLLAPFLSKVLSSLARHGFVVSRKGRGGGFRLAPGAEKRRVGDLVRALEGRDILSECVFGFPECSDEVPCPLHESWSQIVDQCERLIHQTRIGDLNSAPGKDFKK